MSRSTVGAVTALVLSLLAGCALHPSPPAPAVSSAPVRIYFDPPPHAKIKGRFTASCFFPGRLIPGRQLNEQLATKTSQLGGNAVVLYWMAIGGAALQTRELTLQGWVVEAPEDPTPPHTYVLRPEGARRRGFFTLNVFCPNLYLPTSDLRQLLAAKERKFQANAEVLTTVALGGAGGTPFFRVEGVAFQVPRLH